ncbi:putative zinc finger, CCHC-type containing protein [Tanacetum coccineum]
MGVLATIQEGNKCTEETKAKADVFLHQHIDEMLEFEYSSCDDPSSLWKDLEIRFNNQREVLLPSARDEWNNLRNSGNKRGRGYPGSTMMKRIVENTHGHPLKDQKFSKLDKVPLCTSCSLGKLIVRPSPLKIKNESPMFLERIQDGAKFLAEIIKLRAHFPDYTVKRVRLDNAGEFTSHAFNDYCMSVRIVVEHSVAHVHTQNEQANCETEVQKIMHLQEIANQLPDAFTDTKRVTKSHVPTANAPARVEIPNKQVGDNIAQGSQKALET